MVAAKAFKILEYFNTSEYKVKSVQVLHQQVSFYFKKVSNRKMGKIGKIDFIGNIGKKKKQQAGA